MLPDVEILSRLSKQELKIGPFPGEWKEKNFDSLDWFDFKSPVQAASVDLHVGYIYIPGSKQTALGSEGNGEHTHTLKPGESVIVSTFEVVDLPGDVAGIVFAPSSLSSSGILVANIGHIDPGYHGQLRFTLINMGGENFPLKREKDAVGTLMLFETDVPSKKSYVDRAGEEVLLDREPNSREINSLSRDFADIEKRINYNTDKRIKKIVRQYKVWSFIVPFVFGVVASYLTISAVTGSFIFDEFYKINNLIDGNAKGIYEIREILGMEQK